MYLTHNIILNELLQQNCPRGYSVPVEFDLEELLLDEHLIGIIWNVQLVLEERPDLTEEQAWKVLQACQPPFEEVTDPIRRTVHQIAEEMFPLPKGRVALRAYLTRTGRQIDALPEKGAPDPAG